MWSISQRRNRRTMASAAKVFASCFSAGSAADRPTFDFECRPLPESNGLPMAGLAARLSEVENGLHDLPALANRGALATITRCSREADSPSGRQAADPECGNPRQSVDSYGRRGRRTRLRRRKEDHRSEAARRRRHLGDDPGRRRTWGLLARRRSLLRADENSGNSVRLKVVFADSAYGRCDLPGWVKETFGWILQTVLWPVKAKGFVVLPKRWIVERTFAWISRCRRNSKDYERTTETSETMIYITMIALMSRRLARQNTL